MLMTYLDLLDYLELDLQTSVTNPDLVQTYSESEVRRLSDAYRPKYTPYVGVWWPLIIKAEGKYTQI